MRPGRALVVAMLVAGCTPIEAVGRFDGEVAGAKERRRVVALASPT